MRPLTRNGTFLASEYRARLLIVLLCLDATPSRCRRCISPLHAYRHGHGMADGLTAHCSQNRALSRGQTHAGPGSVVVACPPRSYQLGRACWHIEVWVTSRYLVADESWPNGSAQNRTFDSGEKAFPIGLRRSSTNIGQATWPHTIAVCPSWWDGVVTAGITTGHDPSASIC